MKQIITFLAGAIIAIFFYWLIDNNLYEYHFNVVDNRYDIYSDNLKLIGRINYGDNNTLDSLIDNDNQ